jgi:hypothetical protein
MIFPPNRWNRSPASSVLRELESSVSSRDDREQIRRGYSYFFDSGAETALKVKRSIHALMVQPVYAEREFQKILDAFLRGLNS